MFGDNREVMRKRMGELKRAFDAAKTQRLPPAVASTAALHVDDPNDYGWVRFRGKIEIDGKPELGPLIVLHPADDIERAANEAVDWISAQQ